MKKKYIFYLFLLLNLLLVSCGGDDITKLNTGEGDKPSFGQKEILGDKVGIITISMAKGSFKAHTDIAKAWFSVNGVNKEKLNLAIINPEELKQSIQEVANFQSTDLGCNFSVSGFTPSEKTGKDIPEYIKSWYKEYAITKVVYDKLECTEARYINETKSITMTFQGLIKVYVDDDLVSGQIPTIFTFTNLVDE